MAEQGRAIGALAHACCVQLGDGFRSVCSVQAGEGFKRKVAFFGRVRGPLGVELGRVRSVGLDMVEGPLSWEGWESC